MTIPIIFAVFVLGWVTEQFSLFDVGRYSFPLILFAALPFCIRWRSNYTGFLVLPIASSIFAILVAVINDVNFSHILSQATLQTLAIVFAGGVASIDWRKHLNALTGVMVGIGLPVVAYAGYQMVARLADLPGAFLPITNKQYYAEGSLQLGWDKDEVTRASSVFSEPSELGFFCLWLLAIGLSQKSGKLRNAALVLGVTGILFSQSLSAVLGTFVLIIVFLISQPISKETVRQLTIGALTVIAAVALMSTVAPDSFDRLSERVVQAVNLDSSADSGRIDHLPAIINVVSESPVWGHGISSYAGSTSTGSDATTINYAMLLMERGVLGAALFLIPWFAFAARAWFMPISYPGRSVALLLIVATLHAYCSFSLEYFLPFWFALGITASIVNSYRTECNGPPVLEASSADPIDVLDAGEASPSTGAYT
jgi:O-Antigen ligase